MQSPLLITSFADQRCDPIFIDKTGMLSYLNEAIDRKERFHCVTMPSRFGKTYIADMVAAYYTNEGDSREAFKGLSIEHDPSFEKHLNKHNVIKLDIGGICAFVSKEKAIESICGNILGYLCDHFPLTDVSGLLPAQAIARVNAKVGATFVFVIDEWDYLLRNHPEDTALFDSYIGLLRSLFKSSHTISAIDLVYMTGIFPIKRSSDMSGLNVFEEYTMLKPKGLARYYGFSEKEVLEAMRQSSTTLSLKELKEWYDGYYFPSVGEVYCPNSVVKACADGECGSYFADTMADSAITNSLRNNHISLSAESAVLLEGGEVRVGDPTDFNDISNLDTPDKGLIALVHSGFLLFDRERFTVRIPNKEVMAKFAKAVKPLGWGQLPQGAAAYGARLVDAVLEGDSEKAKSILDKIHYPLAGPFHHATEDNFAVCMRALIFPDPRYAALSETYMGYGRAILVCLPTPEKGKGLPAIVIELKVDRSALAALSQIKDRAYSSSLVGYEGNIIEVGINYDPDSKTHQVKIDRA